MSSEDESTEGRDIVRRWLDIKKKISELQEEEEELKEKIHNILKKEETGKIIIGNKIISRYRVSKEVIYKKNVPSSVWEKYCKEIIYYGLRTRSIK